MNQTPDPWASAMIRAGLTDPRYADDRPSLGRLAERAGLHTTTVSRMVHGRGRPDPANVARVADALGVDVVEVSGWANQARSVSQPWRPPAEVDQLSRREQDALTELIRSMAEAREKAMGNAEHPAPTSDPSVTVTESEVIVPGVQGPPRRGAAGSPRRGRKSRR